ncbi:NAD(P)-dependent oxidoreductase [Novosphingobium profundi]|uniref:NAD-dependent epimerase/dehydratase family protein n=1 Tax=Novosphingobium profundi TaxID=1774954 RepID=UPI001BDAE7E7|nr:NAD(P)-dependent oxidoreductase [Novosphingobium profundi]MBT0668674.1 NAD(P)-dependent oxidoreductase [Novosphingobium profundi]
MHPRSVASHGSLRLAPAARAALADDDRRIVIVGARGWIGQTLLNLLDEALGADGLAERVVCFGSAPAEITLESGTVVSQRALPTLADLETRPTLLFHLAFLTMDKVSGMVESDYVSANKALSRQVHEALDPIGVDRLFVASSGAAAFADDPQAAAPLRLYGRLKCEDEVLFARWANARADRGVRAAIGRIYSVSGPFMNKHGTYALASFILDALAARPIMVRAPMPVLRSYVAVRELVSFVVAELLGTIPGPAALHFETAGEALELAEVAACVAQVLGTTAPSRTLHSHDANRYVGDHLAWQDLLGRHAIAHMPLEEQIRETAAWFVENVAEEAAVPD